MYMTVLIPYFVYQVKAFSPFVLEFVESIAANVPSTLIASHAPPHTYATYITNCTTYKRR